MLDGFGGEFRSSKTKMDWKHLRILYPHDSLHHLLPGKGVCMCVFVCVRACVHILFMLMCVQIDNLF